jgi:hypothetical protein
MHTGLDRPEWTFARDIEDVLDQRSRQAAAPDGLDRFQCFVIPMDVTRDVSINYSNSTPSGKIARNACN